MPFVKVAEHLFWNEEADMFRIEGVQNLYVHAFEPFSRRGAKGKFSIKARVPKDTHKGAIKWLSEHIKAKAKEQLKEVPGGSERFLKDGQLIDKLGDDEKYFYMSASEENAPVVKMSNKKDMSEEDAEKYLYAGAIVGVLFRPWYQNNDFGKKINANFLGIQFIRHADRLEIGGRTAVDDDAFGDYGETAEPESFEDDDGFGD